MGLFLVDYENVNSDGLTGIETLTDIDIVIIFYSKENHHLHINIINLV